MPQLGLEYVYDFSCFILFYFSITYYKLNYKFDLHDIKTDKLYFNELLEINTYF